MEKFKLKELQPHDVFVLSDKLIDRDAVDGIHVYITEKYDRISNKYLCRRYDSLSKGYIDGDITVYVGFGFILG